METKFLDNLINENEFPVIFIGSVLLKDILKTHQLGTNYYRNYGKKLIKRRITFLHIIN